MVIIYGKPQLVASILDLIFLLVFIAFIRYVIGLKHWRNYSVISLSFSAYLFARVFKNFYVGLLVWLYFVFVSIFFASLVRKMLLRAKMNYYARLGLIYTGGFLGVLIGWFFITLFTSFNPLNYNFTTISLIFILAALDDLTVLKLRKDRLETFRRIFITIIIAMLTSVLFNWDKWNIYLYTHQEILFLFIAVLVIIARWKYINLVDILRFKSIVEKKSE